MLLVSQWRKERVNVFLQKIVARIGFSLLSHQLFNLWRMLRVLKWENLSSWLSESNLSEVTKVTSSLYLSVFSSLSLSLRILQGIDYFNVENMVAWQKKKKKKLKKERCLPLTTIPHFLQKVIASNVIILLLLRYPYFSVLQFFSLEFFSRCLQFPLFYLSPSLHLSHLTPIFLAPFYPSFHSSSLLRYSLMRFMRNPKSNLCTHFILKAATT